MYPFSDPSKPGRKSDDKEVVTVTQRLLGFCFAVLLGVILLSLALELLAAIWGWLVLVALVGVGIWIGIVVYQHRRDRW